MGAPHLLLLALLAVGALVVEKVSAIRLPDRSPSRTISDPERHLEVAVFALGSFWRSEAVFGCLPGVVRTTAGYAGGHKVNPEYRNLGDHAECVKVDLAPLN